MALSSTPDIDGSVQKDELLEDLQSAVGFEQVDDAAREALIKEQADVLELVTAAIEAAGDADDLQLPRALEQRIARIYALKEQAVAAKRASGRSRADAYAAEAQAAYERPLAPEQQEAVAAAAKTIESRTGQVINFIRSVFGRKDRGAETAARDAEAEEIAKLRRGLQGPTTDRNA